MRKLLVAAQDAFGLSAMHDGQRRVVPQARSQVAEVRQRRQPALEAWRKLPLTVVDASSVTLKIQKKAAREHLADRADR